MNFHHHGHRSHGFNIYEAHDVIRRVKVEYYGTSKGTERWADALMAFELDGRYSGTGWVWEAFVRGSDREWVSVGRGLERLRRDAKAVGIESLGRCLVGRAA